MAKPDTPKTQSGKFKDKARELKTDENEEAFDKTLGRVVPRDKQRQGKKQK